MIKRFLRFFLKPNAVNLSAQTNDVLETFNKTISSLEEISNNIHDSKAKVDDKMAKLKEEKNKLENLAIKNSRIIANFKSILEV